MMKMAQQKNLQLDENFLGLGTWGDSGSEEGFWPSGGDLFMLITNLRMKAIFILKFKKMHKFYSINI
jgi:hypothetical protein